MNKYSSNNLEKKISRANKTSINPLEIISSSKNHKKNLMAVNEVSIFRQSRQTASLKLEVGSKTIITYVII
jgi:NAD+ kinase